MQTERFSTMLKLIFILVMFSFSLPVFAQFGGGSGTENDPYLIATAEHLNSVRNYMTSDFLQTDDIDLGIAPYNLGGGWIPLGADLQNVSESIKFTGSYDGSNYEIRNLLINRPLDTGLALFYDLMNAEISNVRIVNATVTGFEQVAGLAAIAEIYDTGDICSITNCYVSGTISNYYNNTGGLVAEGHYADFTRCIAIVNITGEDFVGGMVGASYEGTFTDCFARGSITARFNVGGLLGYGWSQCMVTNCYSTVSVTGEGTYVGGLIGRFGGGANYSYWDTEASGQPFSADGIGLSTDDMTYPYSMLAYLGWDFDSIWANDESYTQNNGYPYLRSHSVSNDDIVLPSPGSATLKAYPNPFTEKAYLRISLPQRTQLEIGIYNLKGQCVRKLVNTGTGADFNLSWDGRDTDGNLLPNGIYVCSVKGSGVRLAQKIIRQN